MPLINNHDVEQITEPNRNRSPSKPWWKQKKWIFSSILAVLVMLIGYFMGVPAWNNHAKAQEGERLLQQNMQQGEPVNKGKTPNNLNLAHGDENHRVTTGDDLKNAAETDGILYLKGYFGAPSQPGLNKIPTMPVNAGVSDKVLAYGAGEVETDRELGKGNYVMAFHNEPYGKALQHMDPSKKPKVYLTDNRKVYEYELSDLKSVYKAGNDYANAIKQTDNAKITVYTCDEPYAFFIPKPDNRLIASGDLVKTYPIEKAPQAVKTIFSS